MDQTANAKASHTPCLSNHSGRQIYPDGSARAQDTTESRSVPLPNASSPVVVMQGNYNNVHGNLNLHNYLSAPTLSGLERAVNELAKDLILEKVKLTPDFEASIQWSELPPGFCINFSDPVVVGYRGALVFYATAGMISSDHQPHNVPMLLPDKNEKSFRDLASDILKKDIVELTLRGDFALIDINYKLDARTPLNAKMTLDGLDSLQGAIDLEDVKILSRFQDGLNASVKATIKNRTCIDIGQITLKSADILYNSTRVLYIDIGSCNLIAKKIWRQIGYHKDQIFKLSPGLNIQTFSWIFTPPLATDGDEDFRGFISKFLTTDEVINITLNLKRIQIKAGDRLVELDGIEVNTSIKGIKRPLITRVDVYLGLSALRQEVSFRFRLENPLHAPIEVIDSEVYSTFNGHLISHFVHCFKHLSVSEHLEEHDSEVVTAKLNNSLLETIWLVRGGTKIQLEVNIRKCKISIDGREIQNLEFKLHDVTTEIHFGKPA